MAKEIREQINNPFIGTIYEGGYGYSFSYIMNRPDYDLDMKYVASVYGLFFKSDGSGYCDASQDYIINGTAHMKKADFIAARKRLEEADILFVKARKKRYSDRSEKLVNETTCVTLNLRPKDFKENEGSAVRYDNILSYHYGKLPRCIFEDTGLERVDKVIASYLFANIGNIREYLLSGVKLRKNLLIRNKKNELVEMTPHKFSAAIRRLKPYFELKHLSEKEVSSWRKEKYQEETEENTHGDFYIVCIKNREPAVKEEENGERNNYSMDIPTDVILGTDDFSVPCKDIILGTDDLGTDDVGTVDVGTDDLGTAIISVLDNIYTENKNYDATTSIYPESLQRIDDRDENQDLSSINSLKETLSTMKTESNGLIIDNLLAALQVLAKDGSGFAEKIRQKKEELPGIVSLTIEAYEEYSRKGLVKNPRAYLAATFREKLENAELYLKKDTPDELREQYFKWYRTYLAYTDNMLARNQVLPPEVMQAFKAIGSSVLRNCSDPERYYETFRKEYAAAIEGR